MSGQRFAVGLPDDQGLAAWAHDVAGGDASRVDVLTAGSINASAIEAWFGVPALNAGRVGLQAPEPIPGESPRWLEFGAGETLIRYWTSDLTAIRVALA